MAAIHWKQDFLNLDSSQLLPSALPTELLISIARSLAMYKDGALDRKEMLGVWAVLETWIGRLLDAKDEQLKAIFSRHRKHLLPKLADELDVWIQMELVSRQIGYPTYKLTFATLFIDQFESETA